jgi:hypothetical protein
MLSVKCPVYRRMMTRLWNNKLKRMCKEAVVAQFDVILQNVAAGSAEETKHSASTYITLAKLS